MFIITPEPELCHIVDADTTLATNSVFPHIAVSKAFFFLNYQKLSEISCLQMSDNGLYVTWSGELDDDDLDDRLSSGLNSAIDDLDDGLLPTTVFYIDVHPDPQRWDAK
jgi:hypothetical protein